MSAENVHSIRAIMAPEDALYSLCIKKPSFYFPNTYFLLPNKMYSHSHERILKLFAFANPQKFHVFTKEYSFLID